MTRTQLLEFSIKHFGLIGAIVATLCVLGVLEYLQWRLGSQAISPRRASLLMNRHHAKIIDLRDLAEFSKAHLPEAIHLSDAFTEEALKQLELSGPIIFITLDTAPSFYVLKKFRAAGCLELYHLKGGIVAWEESNLPTVRSLLKN